MNRTGFIGGSDCTKIMGDDWYDLWQIKTKRKEPEDLSNNHQVQIGILTEAYNLQVFAKEYECGLENFQKEFALNYNGVPLKGTIDASVVGQSAIVEAKHTNSFAKIDAQVNRYYAQLQFYMWLSNTSLCYFPNFFGNGKPWKCIAVPKDGAFLDRLKEKVFKFWQYVIEDKEPEIKGE
mgnify:FL=1|tara:strand:- start:686 stop:1222 length:537 start_codon:yes stop_codon:yes gene_type:complete